MQSSVNRILSTFVLVFLSLVIGISWVQAEEQRDMQGWGIDDPYNKLYDVREFEKIRGWVVRVKEVVPMPGMSPSHGTLFSLSVQRSEMMPPITTVSPSFTTRTMDGSSPSKDILEGSERSQPTPWAQPATSTRATTWIARRVRMWPPVGGGALRDCFGGVKPQSCARGAPLDSTGRLL